MTRLPMNFVSADPLAAVLNSDALSWLLLSLVSLVGALVLICLFDLSLDGHEDPAMVERSPAHRAAVVVAADALMDARIDRTSVDLDVLADIHWGAEDTTRLLGEVGHDASVARDVLEGVTHGWAEFRTPHVTSGPCSGGAEAVLLWARVGMHLRSRGTLHLASALSAHIRSYDTYLPKTYTAWAFAAGMGRVEASARWTGIGPVTDPVRRIARDRGMDLSTPHATTARRRRRSRRLPAAA